MKKRLFSLLTSLIMVVSLFSVLPTMSVGALTSGDFEYEILDDGTVEISSYNGSATEVTIPSEISGKVITRIGNMAFGYYDSLTSIIIPDSVTSIGNGAFYACSNLKSLKIPEKVTIIEDHAFSSCISLENISFNNNLNDIGEFAFAGCGFTSITLPGSLKSVSYESFSSCHELTTVIIKEGVGTIEPFAFSQCSNLQSVIIPNSVTKIYDYALHNYENLVIKCYANSTAHQYAIDNDIDYELIIDKPTSFKMALNSTSSVRLSWDKVEDADGYIIEQYKNNNWTQIGKITNPSTVQYSVKRLASGTTYKFRMKAYKTISGNTVYSDYTNTLTTCTKPATPKAKMALNSSSSIRLSWDKITGAGGYIVEQYKGGKWVRVTKITSPSTIQYSVKGLASGTTYKFRVRAYKMLSGKAYYSSYSSTVTTCTKPATVKFTLTAGTNKATVKWSKVTGASGYIVYYKTSANGSWTRLKKVGSSTTSYTKTGLTKGKTYYFTVKPYKTLGGKVYYGGITSKSVKVK